MSVRAIAGDGAAAYPSVASSCCVPVGDRSPGEIATHGAVISCDGSFGEIIVQICCVATNYRGAARWARFA